MDYEEGQVFVVPVARNPNVSGPGKGAEQVFERRLYSFPAGKVWPEPPPSYFGFHMDGKLQSVHKVEGHELLPASTKGFPFKGDKSDQYICYLGVPIIPKFPIRNDIKRHCTCDVDTLLWGHFKTISEARDETERREKLRKESKPRRWQDEWK